jgi:glycosyltransferase 2 family protein
MSTFWKTVVLLAALALFGWYLSRADLRAVGTVLGRLGWLAPVMLVPFLVVYFVDCLGWRLCLPAGLKVSFAALFRIRWAGEAVNNVVPSGYVGGEVVKVYLLKKHGVPAQVGTSSAVVSKTAQTVAQLLCIMLATIAFLKLGGDNPGLRAGMMLVLSGGVALLAGLFWIQARGLFGSWLALAGALHMKFAFVEKHRASIVEADYAITGFYRNHRPRFYTATAIYLGGWLLDTFEIYVVSHLLGMPILWTQALAVETFTSVAKVLGMWVPGSLGVQDSGIVMLGRLAGLPDTLCVAYVLLRRAREILFALIGWLLLYAEHASLRAIKAETASLTGESRKD